MSLSQFYTFCALYWHILENLETTFDLFNLRASLLFRLLEISPLDSVNSFLRRLLHLPSLLLILAKKFWNGSHKKK